MNLNLIVKPEEMQENSVMKAQAQQLALIVVVLGILMFLLSYLVDTSILFKYWWLGMVYQWIVPIGLSIYAVSNAKRKLNGFISFKSAFGTSVIGLIIGTTIVVLFNALMYNVIDTDFKAEMENKTIEFTVQFMERVGAADEQIDDSIALLEKKDQFGWKAQIMGLTFISVFYLLISLIVAAAMKKNNPEF
jgi:hypothetical protein